MWLPLVRGGSGGYRWGYRWGQRWGQRGDSKKVKIATKKYDDKNIMRVHSHLLPKWKS